MVAHERPDRSAVARTAVARRAGSPTGAPCSSPGSRRSRSRRRQHHPVPDETTPVVGRRAGSDRARGASARANTSAATSSLAHPVRRRGPRPRPYPGRSGGDDCAAPGGGSASRSRYTQWCWRPAVQARSLALPSTGPDSVTWKPGPRAASTKRAGGTPAMAGGSLLVDTESVTMPEL